MANLIPPHAKKEIITEYWFRVVIVWCCLISIGLLIVALLKVPALMLIASQEQEYSGVYDSAQQKADTLEESQVTIKKANTIAQLLAKDATTTSPVAVLSTLDAIAGPSVQITGFQIAKDKDVVTSISVSGIAHTRTALANFRSGIEEHVLFDKAELPISNLAKERDIAFNISITPSDP